MIRDQEVSIIYLNKVNYICEKYGFFILNHIFVPVLLLGILQIKCLHISTYKYIAYLRQYTTKCADL